MSKTITMNIRIDEETRRGLKDFAAEVGIPATSLVNASIRQMLRSRAVTFSTALEPTPYLEKILREADMDIKTGKNLSPVFDSVDDMFDHLRKTA
jgi:antitoxin component of RelBE/YafQ-DinJ toxin-antitoxin module